MSDPLQPAFLKDLSFFLDILQAMRGLLVVADAAGKVEWVNRYGARILSAAPKQLRGSLFWNLFEGRDASLLRRSYEALLSGETAVDMECTASQTTGERRHLACVLSAYRDQTGQVRWLVLTGTDITQQKRYERDVRLRTAALENATDAVGMADLSFRHFYHNKAFSELIGHSLEALSGREVSSVYADPSKAKEVHRAILAGESWQGEVELLKKDGSTCLVELSASPVRDAQGKIVALMGVHRNLTQQKQREEERLAMERHQLKLQKLESISTLAEGIAHDFNNILAGILSNATLARTFIPENHPAEDLLAIIERATEQASSLTRAILTYARGGERQIEPININLLVQDILSLLRSRVPPRTKLSHRLGHNLSMVAGDPSHVEQAVMNLCINAIEAVGDKKGRIQLSTYMLELDEAFCEACGGCEERLTGAFVCVEVTDTGSGLDENAKQRAFDPYFSTKGAGRGLGLSVAQGIVRNHGGCVSIFRLAEGGCLARILFPALIESSPEQPKRSRSSDKFRGDETVLLVDDNDLILAGHMRLLKSLGYTVLAAADGEEALDQYKRRHEEIDLVILDLVLPKLSGDEILKRMRHIDDRPKVLLYTGFDDQAILDRKLGDAVDGVMHKPCRIDVLSRKIRETLDQASSD